jgi:uncharacterized DUF497 family protein
MKSVQPGIDGKGSGRQHGVARYGSHEFYDDEHSEWEDRFLLLGVSSRLRVLMVCHCLRKGGDVIRIVSARKATAAERKHYPGATA